jgi:hypothetical protein
MKRLTLCCAILAVCVAAGIAAVGPAAAVTAILTDKADVYRTPEQVIETLPAGTKVITGAVNGEWVAVSYQKEGEEAPREGWVNRTLLEEIPPGYDARVSAHIIVHAEDPANIDRFDLKVTEDLYRSIGNSLTNAENEPAFTPVSKLRIYLFNRNTFRAQAKRAGEPDDSIAFSPALGQVYLDFSLSSATPPMKGVIVHEIARLVLRDYSMQPQGRAGAGGPLPLWIVETFAVYQQFQAGYNTDILVYMSDRPKVSSLVNARSLPSHRQERDAYLATAGSLGYMLFGHGTREQFSHLIRIIQVDGGRTRGDALLYQLYGLTAAGFRSEWIRYVDQLKQKHNIKRLEEDIKEEERIDQKDKDPFS